MAKKKKKLSKAEKRFKRQRKTIEFREDLTSGVSEPPHKEGLSKAPDGFRAIRTGEAITEFAKPLVDFMGKGGDLESLQAAIGIAGLIWNLGITYETDRNEGEKQYPEIMKRLADTLNVPEHEIDSLMEVMLDRKYYMFPPEIQPKGTMTMFMRIEDNE